MQMTVTVEGIGKVTITDRDFLASGGEASVYVRSNLAYKIYHDPNKMIPITKIEELRKITATNVLKPLHIIYDKSGKEIGYAMNFKKDTDPICRLFTKAFKLQNNVNIDQINVLVANMQETITAIHREAKCLIVDLNELNVLSSNTFDASYFIDVDSYQTPNHRATAIMESIRDRLVKNNQWHEGSDWFSFAVLAFQMWIGIHPYKGRHPAYKPDEWIKRMEDGISVFDKDVSLPKVCEPFSIIPNSHLAWLKDIFVNNKRYPPPLLSSSSSVSVPDQFRFISVSSGFDIIQEEEIDELVKNVFSLMGVQYMVGSTHVYKGKSQLPVDITNCKKVAVCETGDIHPVVCKIKNGTMTGEDIHGKNINEISASDFMYRNGCVYAVCGDQLVECVYKKFGEKVIAGVTVTSGIHPMSTLVFDGVIFHNLLGKTYIVLPYEKGKCINTNMKELDGYRVINARSERNVVAVMAEKSGKYDRFIFTFDARFEKYETRKNNDVSYSDMNLTVMPNGVAILANNDSVEIFKGSNVKVIDNPPFNSVTKIFNVNGKLMFFDGKKIFSCKMK